MTLQACLESLGSESQRGLGLLELDIVNAFNTIDHTAILNSLRLACKCSFSEQMIMRKYFLGASKYSIFGFP